MHAITEAQGLLGTPQAHSSLAHVAQAPEAAVAVEADVGVDVDADLATAPADCHDGSCQLCGVCHQSASLTAMPLVLPVFPTHALPGAVPQLHAAGVASLLIKPPIS